jgi:hypothetical protein
MNRFFTNEGIDNGARRVYVHSTPNAEGSNPGSGRHSRRRRGSRASAELVGVLLVPTGTGDSELFLY